MGFRRSALVLLSAVVWASGFAQATGNADPHARPPLPATAAEAFGHYRTSLQDTLQRGDEELRRFFAAINAEEQAQQAEDDRFEVTWVRDVHDLTKDGAKEVLVERLRFSLDPVGFGFTGDYRAQVLNGRRGYVMWSYHNEYEGGWPTLAMPIRIGRGAPAFLFPRIDNQSASSPTYRLTLEAVDEAGAMVWGRVFTTTYAYGTGSVAATDAPTTFQRFDADGRPASEFLVALTDYANAAVPDRTVAQSHLYVLDARDGSMTPKGTVGPERYWFPSIQAGPDIDGDGGQDIVIAGEENSPASYVETRSGASGDTIWRQETYLGWYPWAGSVPDMTSDGVRDLVVGWNRPRSSIRMFQVWDARRGRPLWTHKGTFPYLLGDADGDGTTDIGAYRFLRDERKTGVQFVAFGKGRLIYKRSYVRKLPDCRGFCFSSGFYLDAGDLDDDDLRDTYVLASYPTNGKPKIEEYAVAGADGRLLYRARRIAPIRGSLDGRGDDLVGSTRIGKGALQVTAYDGRTKAVLWRRTFQMAGVRNLGPYGAYDAAAELDGDPGTELLLTFTARGKETLVALQGTTGRLMWQRPIIGHARATES